VFPRSWGGRCWAKSFFLLTNPSPIHFVDWARTEPNLSGSFFPTLLAEPFPAHGTSPTPPGAEIVSPPRPSPLERVHSSSDRQLFRPKSRFPPSVFFFSVFSFRISPLSQLFFVILRLMTASSLRCRRVQVAPQTALIPSKDSSDGRLPFLSLLQVLISPVSCFQTS